MDKMNIKVKKKDKPQRDKPSTQSLESPKNHFAIEILTSKSTTTSILNEKKNVDNGTNLSTMVEMTEVQDREGEKQRQYETTVTENSPRKLNYGDIASNTLLDNNPDCDNSESSPKNKVQMPHTTCAPTDLQISENLTASPAPDSVDSTSWYISSKNLFTSVAVDTKAANPTIIGKKIKHSRLIHAESEDKENVSNLLPVCTKCISNENEINEKDKNLQSQTNICYCWSCETPLQRGHHPQEHNFYEDIITDDANDDPFVSIVHSHPLLR